ncbi:MAG TPA: CocE/NonD family hydrolase [Mycobacteriales bacterium]|nr:CocE/NonD family hydrolase [Mycobacteriales bacterium]
MTDIFTTDGLRRRFNVGVPMRDGVALSADVTLPTTLPAPAVFALTPYGKDTPNAAAITAAYAQAGYVFALTDARGRGDSSGGPFVPYRHDGKDGADAIAWLAAQEWCTGDVVTWGGSYLGRNQWLMALEQPPALKAMVVQVCPSDAFVEWPTGTQTLMLIQWHSVTNGRVPQVRAAVDWDRALRHLPIVDIGEAAGFHSQSWRDDLAHPTFDDYWAEIAYQRRFAEIDLPVLHISGWYDDEAVGTPRNFLGMQSSARSDRARRAQRMLMGPWGHAVNTGQKLGDVDFGETAVIDQRALEFAWLDHVLRGVDAGDFTADKPVRIFVMGANEWRDEPSWPPPYVEEAAYFLRDAGQLTTAAPTEAQPPTVWRHDPFDPVPFLMPLSAAQLGGPDDYREVEQRDDVLVFTTPELTDDVEVIGPVQLRCFVATSALDTDVVARLIDLHPDGFAQRLCDGIVRLRYRDGMDKALDVEPDQVYEVDIDMWDTAHRFLAGHAIRLEVMSSAFPKYDRNLGTGGDMITETEGVVADNRIWHDAERPSRLLLRTSR